MQARPLLEFSCAPAAPHASKLQARQCKLIQNGAGELPGHAVHSCTRAAAPAGKMHSLAGQNTIVSLNPGENTLQRKQPRTSFHSCAMRYASTRPCGRRLSSSTAACSTRKRSLGAHVHIAKSSKVTIPGSVRMRGDCVRCKWCAWPNGECCTEWHAGGCGTAAATHMEMDSICEGPLQGMRVSEEVGPQRR